MRYEVLHDPTDRTNFLHEVAVLSDVERADLYRRFRLRRQLVEVVSLGHAYIYPEVVRHLNQ
ncbi:hypothetical protein D3C71_2034280 [compost metagenome]